jgi:hypothetical protein
LFFVSCDQGSCVNNHHHLWPRLTSGLLSVEAMRVKPEEHSSVDHRVPIGWAHAAQAVLKRCRRHWALIADVPPVVWELGELLPLCPLQPISVSAGETGGTQKPACREQAIALD